MQLTGSQYQQLTNALLDAFPTPARLAEMVRFRKSRKTSILLRPVVILKKSCSN